MFAKLYSQTPLRKTLFLVVLVAALLLPFNYVYAGIGAFLGNLVLGIGGSVAAFGGWMLDGAISMFIINIAENLRDGTSLGNAIKSLWGVVRDLVNLIFIFGFVYIGIRTIIDPGRAGTKAFLAQLIIAALLVNFSLFLVQFVVDVTNAGAVEIYNNIGGGEGNIAGKFADYLGATKWFSATSPAQLAAATDDGAVVYYIMGALFLIIAGFTFAAGAFFLLVRYVAIILLMIFSPLIFAAMIFPKITQKSGDLLQKLINYALVAPIYLFFLYLSLRILEAMNSSLTGKSIADALRPAQGGSNPVGSSEIFLIFFIAIALLVASLKAADAAGVYGGAQSVSMLKSAGQKARGYTQRAAGGATFGLTAKAGRATVGRVGMAGLESDRLRNAATKSGWRGSLGRTALRASKATSEASFDARRVGNLGKNLGVGEGKKGGFAQHVTDVKKREEDMLKLLGEDKRVYADAKVEDVLSDYEEAVKERNDALAQLANTDNEDERKILTQKVASLGDNVDMYENAHKKDSKQPDGMADAQWERVKKFSQVKKSSGDLRKEQYAATLERRNDNLWPGVRHAVNFVGDGKYARTEAARAIRKGIKKSDNAKLLDALGGIKGGDKKED